MIEYRRIEMTSPHYQTERILRNVVLLRPIGIPDFGWEKRDEQSFHFVALAKDTVVGCVVLYPNPDLPGQAQLMQMAVSGELQGQGIGTALVDFLVAFANENQIYEVTCHSRHDAVPFYEKLGFEVVGEPFYEVEVEHAHMTFRVSKRDS